MVVVDFLALAMLNGGVCVPIREPDFPAVYQELAHHCGAIITVPRHDQTPGPGFRC